MPPNRDVQAPMQSKLMIPDHDVQAPLQSTLMMLPDRDVQAPMQSTLMTRIVMCRHHCRVVDDAARS